MIGRALSAFPHGSVLMHEREPGERVMVLYEGRVKLTRACGNGLELLIGVRDLASCSASCR